jgi:hypothetical protein
MPVSRNNAVSRLASAHLSGSDALVLRTGEGARFGSPTADVPIRVTVAARSTLVNGQVAPTSTQTIFDCTERVDDTLSGLTAVEGTADQNFSRNDPVASLLTWGIIQETAGTVVTAPTGLLKGVSGTLAVATPDTDYATPDAVAAKADDDAVVKLAGDQTNTGSLTLAGLTIKPDTVKTYWLTAQAGVGAFSAYTNGGFEFNGVIDNIFYFNVYNGAGEFFEELEPTIYDSLEAHYFDGTNHYLEMNFEGNGPDSGDDQWLQTYRWRAVNVNRATGHAAWTHAGDYYNIATNSLQFVPLSIGTDVGHRIPPYGVYEIELTDGGIGYTDGTNYPLILTGGGGSMAAGVFDVVGGVVSAIRLSSSGKNYTSAPTVSFANGGAGTGATADVLIGSISAYLPINSRQPIAATEFTLADTSGSLAGLKIGSLNTANNSVYSGCNLTESGGVYQRFAIGAASGVEEHSSGGINFLLGGSAAAGTTVSAKAGFDVNGVLRIRPGETAVSSITLFDTGYGLGMDANGPVLFTESQVKVKTGGVSGTTVATFGATAFAVPELRLGTVSGAGAIGYNRSNGGPWIGYGATWDVAQTRLEATSAFISNAIQVDNAGFKFMSVNAAAGDPLVTVATMTPLGALTAMSFTPTTKPTITGSRGGNAALADLLTKGATIGLWTDGTSA